MAAADIGKLLFEDDEAILFLDFMPSGGILRELRAGIHDPDFPVADVAMRLLQVFALVSGSVRGCKYGQLWSSR